jgi:hypothetical protein
MGARHFRASIAMPLALTALTPDIAAARQISAGPPPVQEGGTTAAQRCELRIITTKKGLSVADSTDFKGTGLIGGAMAGLYKKPNYQAVVDFANGEIGPEGQERLIRAGLVNLPGRLAGYQVTFEQAGPEALAAFKDARHAPRLTASTASCVAEISVIAIAYVRTSLSRTVDCLFMFRQFGAGPQPVTVVTYANDASVHAFPPKSDGDAPAARAELSTTFATVFAAFLKKIEKGK